MPRIPIKVEILKMERKETTSRHQLNPYLYTIEVKHGPYCWIVQRRYNRFFKLHTSIMFQQLEDDNVLYPLSVKVNTIFKDNQRKKFYS